MNYEKFREDFESSGMSQRAYGEKISMSASMVHYYLKKSEKKSLSAPKTNKSFTPLKISLPKIDRMIVITTPDGTKISIPV